MSLPWRKWLGLAALLLATPAMAEFLAPGDAPKQHVKAFSGGSATQVLHGGRAPAYAPVSLPNDTVGLLPIASGGNGSASPSIAATAPLSVGGAWPNYTIGFAGLLGTANGGTGTGTPGLVAGAGMTITGSWPNQTLSASGFSLPPTMGDVVTNGGGGVAVSNVLDAIAGGMVGDGATNNTAAFQGLLNTAGANGGEIRFPCGAFRVNGGLTQTVAAAKGVTIRGGGAHCTFINFPNGSGLVATLASPSSSFHFRDLSWRTGTATSGTIGITITQAAPTLDPASTYVSDFENVDFGGTDGLTATDYWDTDIKLYKVSAVTFLNVNDIGASSISGTAVDIEGAGDCSSTPGCGTAFLFQNCTINFKNIGVISGNQVQGVEWLGGNMAGDNYDILVPSGGTGAGSLLVEGATLTANNAVIYIQQATLDVTITGNQFILPASVYGVIGILKHFQITGNGFDGNPGSQAIVTQSGTDLGVITGNTFSYGGVGIVGTHVNVQSNVYINGAGTSPASSTGTIQIGGGSS